MSAGKAPARHRASLGESTVVAAATLLILFLRRPDAFLRPRFWAEDFVFLLDAEKFGPATFWTPKGGYLDLIPRTLAWPATVLDPSLQPSLFLCGWLVVMLAVVLSCLSRRHSLPLKPWLAASVFIVPHTGEVFFNPTNAQWVAALGLLLTAVKRDPATAGDWLVDCGLLCFAGLSGPFIFFALPLFVRRAWHRTSRPSYVLLGITALLVALQGWLVMHAPPDTEFTGPFSLFNLLAVIASRVPDNLFFGVLLDGVSRETAVAAGIAVIGFVVFAVSRSEDPRGDLLWFLLFVLALLVATTLKKRFDVWQFGNLSNGDRYFYVPKVVLLWVVGSIFAVQRRGWIRWTALALMLSSVLLNAPHFRFRRFANDRWYAQCPQIRAHQPVELMINPGWRFHYRRGSMESAGPL